MYQPTRGKCPDGWINCTLSVFSPLVRQNEFFVVYRTTSRFAAFYYSNQGEESAGERHRFTRYFAL